MTSKTIRPAYVAGAARIPFVKSGTKYRNVKTYDLMSASLSHLVRQYKLQGKILGDVALGAVMNSSIEWTIAREVVLGSELHPYTPAYFTQRACGTSLDASLQLALKIGAGQIETGIAGGFDTNSDLPILFPRSFAKKILNLRDAKGFGGKLGSALSFGPNDWKPQFPRVEEARTGLSMGEHCELMVKEWKISREAQDEIAFLSHQNAAKAYDEGFFKDLVFEFQGVTADGIVRKDTSMEKLAKLKPAFDKSAAGTLTAGNSSPLTDGSSTALFCSEQGLKDLNVEPWARFVDAQVAAVDFVHGDGLLMAPTKAVAQMLARNGLTLQDFDYYEIHEAFAGQVLCTLKAWESDEYCKKHLGLSKAMGSIDRSKLNVKGSSVATGHPFAATGTRIVGSLAKMLKGTRGKRGLISVCTAGGMGTVAILESV
ncbi:acetyl-CoA C-acetyltransferase [Bdellovibrio sp. HCB337]|uniref:acetyl-CoA C-acetyltransferase n=1 Tax=Bdellovibrio sp. HCB337 TaxID=3394358 RepID=UPI0039A6EA18